MAGTEEDRSQIKLELSRCWAEVNKAIKISSKGADLAGSMKEQTPRFSSRLREVNESLMEGMRVLSGLEFATKFFKNMDNEPLTVVTAADIKKKSVMACQEMKECWLAMKGLLPASKEQPVNLD